MDPKGPLAGPYLDRRGLWVCRVLQDAKEKRETQVRGSKMDPHPESLGNRDARDPKD